MLKLKDNIDLKELEKFGFKKMWTISKFDTEDVVYKRTHNRLFYIWFEEIYSNGNCAYGIQFKRKWNWLFGKWKFKATDFKPFKDLIKAGIVEKVESK